MKSATDRELDAVDAAIEELRSDVRTGTPNHTRLQELYLRRDKLHARQFRALQKKIRSMPK